MKRSFLALILVSTMPNVLTTLKEKVLQIASFTPFMLPLIIDVGAKCLNNAPGNHDTSLENAYHRFNKSAPQFFSGITTGLCYFAAHYAIKKGYILKGRNVQSFEALGLLTGCLITPVLINLRTKVYVNEHLYKRQQGEDAWFRVTDHIKRGVITGSVSTLLAGFYYLYLKK